MTDADAGKHAQSPHSYSSGALRTKVTSRMTNTTFCVVTPAPFALTCTKPKLRELYTEYLASSHHHHHHPSLSPTGSSNSQRKQVPVVRFCVVQGHTRARHCAAPRPECRADRKSNPGSENKNLSRRHSRANKSSHSRGAFLFMFLASTSHDSKARERLFALRLWLPAGGRNHTGNCKCLIPHVTGGMDLALAAS